MLRRTRVNRRLPHNITPETITPSPKTPCLATVKKSRLAAEFIILEKPIRFTVPKITFFAHPSYTTRHLLFSALQLLHIIIISYLKFIVLPLCDGNQCAANFSFVFRWGNQIYSCFFSQLISNCENDKLLKSNDIFRSYYTAQINVAYFYGI